MIQQGKHEAYSQLIEQNTTLIRAVAMQFAKQHSNTILSCDDYEQEGRIALLDAAKRYCPEKGKFQTYATIILRTAMLDALRQVHPEVSMISLEENQQTVEKALFAYCVPSWAMYRKTPEQLYLDKERMMALRNAMQLVSLRDVAWVRHRFGFDGEPCALAAAARDYGLSMSRAKHIVKKALRHFRENLTAHGGKKVAA